MELIFWYTNTQIRYVYLGGSCSDKLRCGNYCIPLNATNAYTGWPYGAYRNFGIITLKLLFHYLEERVIEKHFVGIIFFTSITGIL